MLKRIPMLLASIAIIFVAAAPAGITAASAKDDLQTIRERGLVRIAASNSPPNIVKDIAEDSWSGPYADFYEAVFGAIDVEVEFVDTPWGAVVPSLQSGGIDAAILSVLPARAAAVDNSAPIIFSPLTMLLADEQAGPVRWESLNREDFRVAVMAGTIHEAITRNMLPDATLVVAEDLNNTILLLETGRADAVIGHQTPLAHYSESRGRGSVHMPEPQVGMVNTFVFRKNNPDLKRFLDNSILFMKMSGSLRRIFEQPGLNQVVVD